MKMSLTKKAFALLIAALGICSITTSYAQELYYHGPAVGTLVNGTTVHGSLDNICQEAIKLRYEREPNARYVDAKFAWYDLYSREGSNARAPACHIKTQNLANDHGVFVWLPENPPFVPSATETGTMVRCEYPNTGLYTGKDGCYGTTPPEFPPNHAMCDGKIDILPLNGTGLVACNEEEMHPCVDIDHVEADKKIENQQARQIVYACLMVHENTHIMNASEETQCNLNSNTLQSKVATEYPNRYYYYYLSELHAYTASRDCFEQNLDACGEDTECTEIIQSFYEFHKNNAATASQYADPSLPISDLPINY